MTVGEAKVLFDKLDHNSSPNAPEGFDFEAVKTDADALIRKMEAFFGRRLSISGPLDCQDSGCFTEIEIPGEFIRSKADSLSNPSLSLSCFGHLANSAYEDLLDPELLECLKELCSESGWNYIDGDLLDTVYLHDERSGDVVTWGERFFAHW